MLEADYPAESFDVVTCMDVSEHLSNPSEVLRNVYEWLRPGVIFYVFVPNVMCWEARIFRSYWYGLDLPRHIRRFSAKSLTAVGTSAGLRQVRCATPPRCYLEESTFILFNDLALRAGARPLSWDWLAKPGIAWRVVRKGLRQTVEALYGRVASSFGAGPSIQAVFRKDAGRDSARESPLAEEPSDTLFRAEPRSTIQTPISGEEAPITVKTDPIRGSSSSTSAALRFARGTEAEGGAREEDLVRRADAANGA